MISLFDNSGAQLKNGKFGYEDRSSGKLISLDTKTWTATLQKKFSAPDNIFAFSQGNTQLLPNGNALVNWGSAGAITEFSSDAQIIFHAYLESGELWANGDVQNYRGFKFNWTGVPSEEPAVVALQDEDSSTTVYTSWNGDTETRVWRFYGVSGEGVEVLLGEAERNGFETSFHARGGDKWKGFVAKAIGSEGELLRKSKSVEVERYVGRYVPGKDEYMGRVQETWRGTEEL